MELVHTRRAKRHNTEILLTQIQGPRSGRYYRDKLRSQADIHSPGFQSKALAEIWSNGIWPFSHLASNLLLREARALDKGLFPGGGPEPSLISLDMRAL